MLFLLKNTRQNLMMILSVSVGCIFFIFLPPVFYKIKKSLNNFKEVQPVNAFISIIFICASVSVAFFFLYVVIRCRLHSLFSYHFENTEKRQSIKTVWFNVARHNGAMFQNF